ncbi:MAG TPA: nitroreductase family protein [Kofleriaceae bacterium]|nr:nitroreductase family protein [Kofleriaceae bacterium]
MLAWLRTRRSVRTFTDAPVARDMLERVLEGAITAPSATNRQPWRFAVVRAAAMRAKIVEAVARKTSEVKAVIARSHHAEDFGAYGDFFHEPLAAAQVIVIPQYREYPDLIANLIASGGGDPAAFSTASAMQSELVSTSTAIMTLLLQAHAEGLGACMMAGPMLARDDIHALLGIDEPWRMVGAIALGHPTPAEVPVRGRKPLDRVVTWIEEET